MDPRADSRTNAQGPDDGRFLPHPEREEQRTPQVDPEGGIHFTRLFHDRPELHAGLSLRLGGTSAPPFAALNLGGSTPDDPAALAENRRRFYAAAGLDPARVVRMHQVHGARVVTAAAPGHVGEADGLITGLPDLALLVTVADCLPVFLADRPAGVIGALHAGWRGLLAGVLETGVAAARAAGADPTRIEVAMGPAIGACCFEVGPDVAARFAPAAVRPGPRGRPHVDLAAAARERLLALGVRAGAIHDPAACTLCRRDLYFSARSGEPTGRMVGFIVRRAGGGALLSLLGPAE